MNSKIIYSKTDVMKYFGISKYKINQLLADDILPAPIRKPHRHPYWTLRQIQAAERKLDELAKPAPDGYKPTRGLNAKQIAEIRAYEGLPPRI